MTKQPLLIRIGLAVYLVVFFTYLIGPLILMSITAFNSAAFPQITPWEVLSFEWFPKLFNDDRILRGLKYSLYVGFFTVILSVSMGLAGALILTQIWPKLRATYYTIIIAPILVPGVVIGISTLVFWAEINRILGFSADSFLQNGIFLSVLGQSTFIASYAMLVFVARLQRYDTGLTEAALDLGATHLQAFRKIQLPFLMPAMASSAVLAFLASFENYNTTIFTHQKFATLTIVLSQKVRYGIDPTISALAFIIVCLTVFGALVHEVRTRRVQLALANGAPVGAVTKGFQLPRFFAGNPAAVVLGVFVAIVVGVVAYAQVYDPEPAKKLYADHERALQKKAIEAIQQKARDAARQKQMKGPKIFDANKKTGTPQSPGKETFGNVFKPNNLEEAAGTNKKKKPVGVNPGKGAFGNIWKSDNLKEVIPDKKDK
jgi:spermidine/putrescine transport system permease protein